MRSGLPPAIDAAVKCVIPAQHPLVTMPHGACVISASRLPTASINSSMWTKPRDASSMARFTSGSDCDPVMIVNVPRALITGRTPIDRYIFAVNSIGAANAVLMRPPIP